MRNYATQMDAAKRGIVTPEIETVAKKENRPVEFIMERVAKGTIAIPANINHKSLSAEAVGDGTRVKINVNLAFRVTARTTRWSCARCAWPLTWARSPSWIYPTTARPTPSASS